MNNLAESQNARGSVIARSPSPRRDFFGTLPHTNRVSTDSTHKVRRDHTKNCPKMRACLFMLTRQRRPPRGHSPMATISDRACLAIILSRQARPASSGETTADLKLALPLSGRDTPCLNLGCGNTFGSKSQPAAAKISAKSPTSSGPFRCSGCGPPPHVCRGWGIDALSCGPGCERTARMNSWGSNELAFLPSSLVSLAILTLCRSRGNVRDASQPVEIP